MSDGFYFGTLFKRRKLKRNETNVISEQEHSFIDMQNYFMDDLSNNLDSDCQFSEDNTDNLSEDASIIHSEDDQIYLPDNQLELEQWDTNTHIHDNITQVLFEAFIEGAIMLQGDFGKVYK